LKQLINEQKRAEAETQPNTINPSVMALYYLTRLMKYRRYKEISAPTSDVLLETWTLESHSGVVMSFCTDGKFLYVLWKDGYTLTVIQYGTGFHDTERGKQYRVVTMRDRGVGVGHRVWLCCVYEKLYMFVPNNSHQFFIFNTNNLKEEPMVILNAQKERPPKLYTKRSSTDISKSEGSSAPSSNTIANKNSGLSQTADKTLSSPPANPTTDTAPSLCWIVSWPTRTLVLTDWTIMIRP